MSDEFDNSLPIDDGEVDPFDEFLDGITSEGSTFDPSAVIKIISTGGGTQDIPVDPEHTVNNIPLDQGGELGYTIDEVLALANLAISPNTQFWVNNAQVARSFVVAPGAVITAVGMVKGG